MATARSQRTRDYDRDGYVFPIEVMSTTEVATLRAQVELAECKCARSPAAAKALRAYSHAVLPVLADLARAPAITDRVAEILGEDLLVWGSSFFIKEPHTADYVSWHQDLHYWGLDDTDEVTAWVALSPATIESGCMRFVAGSHLSVVEHKDTFADGNLLTRGQELAVEVDDAKATNVILQPGQMSLHHGRLFHASHANNSDARRIGFAIRYIKPSMRQAHADRDHAMLARGADRHGHFQLIDPPETSLSDKSVALATQIIEERARVLMRETVDTNLRVTAGPEPASVEPR